MTKTIVEKLNLSKYKKAAVLNLPEEANYLAQFENYDTDLAEEKYDLIFAFALTLESLKKLVDSIIESEKLSTNGYLFVAYPKKGNKVYPTFIHRDELLAGMGAGEEGYIGSSNIKFARMVSLDDVFTVVGLKEDAKNRHKLSTAASQCVDDYIEMIPEVENDLRHSPELLAFYQSLTPGYRKDWARFVYSAKQEATKEKRRKEMQMILSAGYKSRDLYQRNN